MQDGGLKLKRTRETLNLRVRDVEQASLKIAEKYKNDDFAVLINRISEIENRGLMPSLHKLYSLAAIYRLSFEEVLNWYGISLASLPDDSLMVEVPRSHLVNYDRPEHASVSFPLKLDPGLDVHRTVYLSRMIQRWGPLPLMFLETLNLKERRYGFIGTDDWFMYPLLHPGSFVMIDESRKKIATSGWSTELDRPIYFLEHRRGYECAWVSQQEGQLILQPHPSSEMAPLVFAYPSEIDIVGQVVGVAMRLDQGPRRRTRS